MPDPADPKPLTLCLVTDDDLVASAVRVSCPPPHRVEVAALADVVNEKNSLSEQGRALVRAASSYDAVLIDWSLEQAPVINTLCYHVRRTVSAPLIALCRGAQETQVAALAAGADGVLSFPFYPSLVQALRTAYLRLVEAAQRAEPGATPAPTARDVLRAGELWLDRSVRKCFVRDVELELTFREFTLLEYLLERAGTACSRDQILDHVWGIRFDTGTNMVDVYVYFLRKKLAAHGFTGVIETVRGYGYRLAPPEED